MSRFFRFLWKFNAVVIAAAGILAIFVLAFAGYHIFQNITATRHATRLINVDAGDNIKEKWFYGRPVKILNSDSIIFPLETNQSFSLAYSGKQANSVRNMLFVNLKTEHSKWLLESNNSLIAHYELLNEKNEHFGNKDIIAIMYLIVKEDTNKDSRLSDEDLKTIAISAPDGSRFTEIISSVNSLLGHAVVDKSKLFIAYQSNDEDRQVVIDMPGFRIRSSAVLPKVEK
jgi:hypothetical protein